MLHALLKNTTSSILHKVVRLWVSCFLYIVRHLGWKLCDTVLMLSLTVVVQYCKTLIINYNWWQTWIIIVAYIRRCQERRDRVTAWLCDSPYRHSTYTAVIPSLGVTAWQRNFFPTQRDSVTPHDVIPKAGHAWFSWVSVFVHCHWSTVTMFPQILAPDWLGGIQATVTIITDLQWHKLNEFKQRDCTVSYARKFYISTKSSMARKFHTKPHLIDWC